MFKKLTMALSGVLAAAAALAVSVHAVKSSGAEPESSDNTEDTPVRKLSRYGNKYIDILSDSIKK